MTGHRELLDEARRRTFLDDAGDEGFLIGLEVLLWSLDHEARLNDLGRAALRGKVLRLLTQRLQVEDWYRRHPEIGDEPIRSPLVIVGLPRTNSTLLHGLLHADPDAATVRWWQVNEPCPPPSTVTPPDPRVARAERELASRDHLMPRLDALVPTTADGPAECIDLLALSFASQVFPAYAHVPTYAAWLRDEADMAAAYAYERRVLQLLQWGRPARPWRLKAPAHLSFLPELDAAFPDARFVMTHRDPFDVLVSSADLYLEVIRAFTDHPDPVAIGRLNLDVWSVAVTRAMAYRDDGNEHRFLDLHFEAIDADPVAAVGGVAAWLGEPVTDRFADGMRRWLARSDATRRRVPRPDAAFFGLDPAEVRATFAPYTARFLDPEATSATG